ARAHPPHGRSGVAQRSGAAGQGRMASTAALGSAQPNMEIHGERVTLRPIRADDAAGLAAILETPEVARWWPAYDLARVEAEFLVNEPNYVVYAIDVDERLVGAI